MRSSIDLPAEAPHLSRASGRGARLTPTATQSVRALSVRRWAMATGVAASYAILACAFVAVVSANGWTLAEIAMFACFLISAPWIIVGFWNALIGFVVMRFARDPVLLVTPCVARARADDPIEGRHAVAMCVRHEDPDRVVRRLDAILASLDATPYGDRFDVFVLSDSAKPGLVAAEEAAIGRWRDTLDDPARVIYRRRTTNAGYKAGNVRDFLERRGDAYRFMVTLDADSLMSGEAILKLVRVMQANPKLGILQSLVVGLPARTVFARAFQFGMRATMRSYTMGAAWWAGDCGPYWGHNAAIRIDAFREHCRLPQVKGPAPLGGDVLSHDLYEATLMRRAGYEVRVLPEEGGSWEDNPATLPEFIRRNLRWCQGNMQYLRLIREPGLPLVGRVNLGVAIMMYVGAPAWIGFMVAAAVQAWDPPVAIAASSAAGFPRALSLALLVVMMAVLFAPKIMGYLDVLLRPAERRRYGGPPTFLAGVAAEIAFGLLFAPIVSFTVTAFLIRLFVFRKAVGWDATNRDGERVGWGEALRLFWPATLFGLALGGSFALSAPDVLVWAGPVIAAFVFAAPFAALTSLQSPLARLGAIPEEANPPAEVRAVMDGFAGLPSWAPPLAPFRFDGAGDARGYSAAASPAE